MASGLEVASKVQFLGARADVPELLTAMDMFLFPSLFEGFPNALLEAQASGLPCVTSDAVTEEVMVTSGVTVVPLESSPEAWAQAVLAVRGEPGREKAAGRLREAGFSIGHEVARIQAVYEDLIKGRATVSAFGG